MSSVDHDALFAIADPPTQGRARQHALSAFARCGECVICGIGIQQVTPMVDIAGPVRVVDAISMAVGVAAKRGLVRESSVGVEDLGEVMRSGALHLQDDPVAASVRELIDGVHREQFALLVSS